MHHTRAKALAKAPRCGAKTRSGAPCRSPRVRDPKGGYRKRCRMHGGADGSGAQKGNKNALKSGEYTREALDARRQHRRELKEFNAVLNCLAEGEPLTNSRDPIPRWREVFGEDWPL